jgi:hypothetical protein
MAAYDTPALTRFKTIVPPVPSLRLTLSEQSGMGSIQLRATITLVATLLVTGCHGRAARQHAEARELPHSDGVAAIALALDSFPIVAIADLHGAAELGAFRNRLLSDPRVLDRINDVVIEAGNSLYQPLADRYVRGDSVGIDSLRLIWNNTTQSPLNTLDASLYAEDILRTVRQANQLRRSARPVRVLLADPPIEWNDVRTRADAMRFLSQRRTSHVRVLADSVLAHRHRAIFICGSLHLMRTTAGVTPEAPFATTTQRVLRDWPRSMYVVLIFDGFGRSAAKYEPLMNALPRESLVPFAAGLVGALSAEEVMGPTPGVPDATALTLAPNAAADAPSIFAGLRMSDLADAYLYLRPFSQLTVAVPDLARYRTTPALLEELDRRQRIMTGEPFDTTAFFSTPASPLLYGPSRGDRNVRRPRPPIRPPQ